MKRFASRPEAECSQTATLRQASKAIQREAGFRDKLAVTDENREEKSARLDDHGAFVVACAANHHEPAQETSRRPSQCDGVRVPDADGKPGSVDLAQG